MPTGLHPHFVRPAELQGPLAEYATRAALLVDANGVVEDATEAASSLLDRGLDDLKGASFGVAPKQWVRIELDVVSKNGNRRVITARPTPLEGGRSVVLLEDATSGASSVAGAAHLALADVNSLLIDHGLDLAVGQWPRANATPLLRPLMARCVECLLEMTRPFTGMLRVTSWISSERLVTIRLELTGPGLADMPVLPSTFEDTLAEVQRAEGYLNLEPVEEGFIMRLTVPAA